MTVRVARSSARFEGGGTRLLALVVSWNAPRGRRASVAAALERESDTKPELFIVSLNSSPLLSRVGVRSDGSLHLQRSQVSMNRGVTGGVAT